MEDIGEERASKGMNFGIHFAVVALAAAALVFVFTQVRVSLLEQSLLDAQRGIIAKRVAELKENVSQIETDVVTREEQIKKATATEARYASLLTELLELSKTDVDARTVTQKWKIQAAGAEATPAAKPSAAATGESREPVKEVPKDVKVPKAATSEVPPKAKAP
jgi:chorismate mutase